MSKSKFKKRNKNFYGGAAGDANSNLSMEINAGNGINKGINNGTNKGINNTTCGS